MVLRESEFSHKAAESSLPLREAFAGLFFVSVGMLFDPGILLTEPLQVLGVVAVIVVGKSLAAALLVLALRYPLNTALTVSASLAQIGEFSFILAAIGLSLGLLPPEGQSLILAGALISIALNPLLFKLLHPLQDWLRAHSALARRLERPTDPLAELPADTAQHLLSKQVVLVGYGKVGRAIAAELAQHDIPFVVADQNRARIEALRAEGRAAVFGDAAEPGVLVQAHIAHDGVLIITTPDPVAIRAMIDTAKTLNPAVELVIRSHNRAETVLLEQEAGARIFHAETELAASMARHVLDRFGKTQSAHRS
jgi:CPA2 family monovalent cation:H+ antiporter-2